MIIIKEFAIAEVRAVNCINAPFQIILEGNLLQGIEGSSLTLDNATCERMGIPRSVELLEKKLMATFVSRELPKEQKNEFAVMKGLTSEDLMISKLEHRDVTSWNPYSLSGKSTEEFRILKMESFGAEGGRGARLSPCPLYRIFLELGEGEYTACKALPRRSIFSVNFQVT
ncbi:MAG: hypothetical protein V4674_01450 [Patescibacteria group bacterium]